VHCIFGSHATRIITQKQCGENSWLTGPKKLIEKAKEKLSMPDLLVSEIAYESGF